MKEKKIAQNLYTSGLVKYHHCQMFGNFGTYCTMNGKKRYNIKHHVCRKIVRDQGGDKACRLHGNHYCDYNSTYYGGTIV